MPLILVLTYDHEGRDPFNQNFRNFWPKTEWISLVQPEKSRKNQSTFRGGPLFFWLDWSDWNGPFYLTIPTYSQSQNLTVRYFPHTKWRKILITALLWIVNSQSIGVTHTFMYSYHRSVAASQAKCMSWLWWLLKMIYFPREFGMLFTSVDLNVVFEVIWQISGNSLLKRTHFIV